MIDLEFANPEFWVRRRRFAPLKPSTPVPKVAIYKHRQAMGSKTDIRSTKNKSIIFLEIKTALFQSLRQTIFRFGLCDSHGAHDSRARRFGKDINHCTGSSADR